MEKPENASEINDRATEWVVRSERDDFGADGRAQLQSWLAGDRRRRGALLRAQAAWAMLDRASVLREHDVIASHARDRVVAPRRRLIFSVGGAVAAAGIAGLGYLAPRATRYRTAVGEVRHVPLPDGSIAEINTDSIVKVSIHPRVRAIELSRGEAWFDVAKDRSRPFIVNAGDVRVRAVGTAFAVRRRDSGADVQVTEGLVEAWSVAAAKRPLRISAGSRAFVSDTSTPISPTDASIAIDQSLAWRDGQVVLDGDTLGEAATEFNRYNDRKIVVDDPALARERLVGRFRANEPEAFAATAAGMLGARIEATVGALRLVRN